VLIFLGVGRIIVFSGEQNDCNLLYLTTKHVFKNCRGKLPSCPSMVVGSMRKYFLVTAHLDRCQTPLRKNL